MNRRKQMVLGVILSGIFLYFSLKDLQFYALQKTLTNVEWSFLFPLTLCVLAFFTIKALRWKKLLNPLATLKVRELYPSMMIGVAMNYLLFGYLGELVRTYLLHRQTQLPKSSVFATIALERSLDVVVILALTAAAYMTAASFPSEYLWGGYVIALLTALFLLTIIAFLFWEAQSMQWFLKLFTTLPCPLKERLEKALKKGIQGFHVMKERDSFIQVLSLSFTQWLMMGGCHFFAMRAVGVEAPFSATFLVMALLTFAIILPSVPGHLGVVEACYVLGLQIFSVPQEQALAAALLFHGILYSSVILTGIFYVRQIGISFATVALQVKSKD